MPCLAGSPHYQAFICDTIPLASTPVLQFSAPVVQREELGDERSRLTLAASQLAVRVRPSHILAIRPAGPVLDPLVRTAVALSGVVPGPDIVSLLLNPGHAEPTLHRGQQVDVLGPIGRGWSLEPWQRNVLLLGTDVEVRAAVPGQLGAGTERRAARRGCRGIGATPGLAPCPERRVAERARPRCCGSRARSAQRCAASLG